MERRRERPLSVETAFLGLSKHARHHYKIIDTKTNQVVAQNDADESFVVVYEGSFSTFNSPWDSLASKPSTVYIGNLHVEGDIRFGNPQDRSTIRKLNRANT